MIILINQSHLPICVYISAMIHSGIGYTQVQHFLTTLNLHGITHTSLKEREIEIGGVMEELAEESVKNALTEEIIASRYNYWYQYF